MENFAEYILGEEDLVAKMEITYYLSKKQNIFFDKSVVLKTELARLFMNYIDVELDKNVVLTACLLCNCKKEENSNHPEKVKTYAVEGANYLKSIGFNNKICNTCEEVNRYSGKEPREKEADLLELVDQYGGMLINREERIGLKPDEALVLLEYRNLKDKYNKYLEPFIDFVEDLESVQIGKKEKTTPLSELVKIYNEYRRSKRVYKKDCL